MKHYSIFLTLILLSFLCSCTPEVKSPTVISTLLHSPIPDASVYCGNYKGMYSGYDNGTISFSVTAGTSTVEEVYISSGVSISSALGTSLNNYYKLTGSIKVDGTMDMLASTSTSANSGMVLKGRLYENGSFSGNWNGRGTMDRVGGYFCGSK